MLLFSWHFFLFFCFFFWSISSVECCTESCGKTCIIYLVVLFWYYKYIRERQSTFFFNNLGKSDAESIFKHLSYTGVGNISKEIVEESIKLMIAKSKVVNRKIKHCLDSLFIADFQIETGIKIYDIISTPSCLEKYTPNETVDMSGETRTLSNTKPQVLVNVISKILLQELWQWKRFSWTKLMSWSWR